MSTSVNEAFVHEFASNVWHLGQQKVSRVSGIARTKYATADKFHWETLAAANMASKSGRHATTPTLNIGHAKRVAAGTTYAWGETIDANDAARVLIDPRSEYTKAAAAAYGRQIDDVILAAAVANAATGIGGSGSTALPAGQKIGGTGGQSAPASS